MSSLKGIDIAFLPVGGTYTMNAEEAARAVEIIKPKVAVPIHYGSIVGSKKDAEKFKSLVKAAKVYFG
jgi:L-ascorbate metabolism protein UlaG (beta-lactamase superfamily)